MSSTVQLFNSIPGVTGSGDVDGDLDGDFEGVRLVIESSCGRITSVLYVGETVESS